ncbi:MAG: hypothetical protein L0Y50_00695 [Beijerinckiaceae bacterium]|nr:hypothetical protein [Beijerinckiaceae bacterium]MCI0734791.1 hypothetical protein [Beijerinckiaceae bacterium]
MTAKNFSRCLAFTLKFEGGKSDDPRDPGGRTNQGVTQRTYDHYREIRALQRRDVYEMSDPERDSIYREAYWGRVFGDGLRDGEDLVVWDFAVNSGPKRALEVWRRCGGSAAPLDDVIHDVCAYRLAFLRALMTWKYFGKGWGRRVAACEALAIKMAHGLAAKEVLVRKASAAKQNAEKEMTQAVIAGTTTGTIAAYHGGYAVYISLAIIIVLAGTYFFRAWRQSQRADALMAAVRRMQTEQAPAFAAKMAAESTAANKQKAIEVEQAAQSAAHGASGNAQISNPEEGRP